MRVDRFRLFRVRSPLLAESLLFSLPPGTEMVHFPGFASPSYGFRGRYSGLARCGFPHSEIPGSQPACGSPRRIVACHVLHRLPAPRHPPYALSSLTIKFTQDSNQWPVTSGQWPATAWDTSATRTCCMCPYFFRYSIVKDLSGHCPLTTGHCSWWAWVELNHRPHPYQGCALAT